MTAPRIAFYGNFGAGNLGNECTLQTVIEQTRRHVPQAQLLCLCTGPADVEARHRIPAFCSEAVKPQWGVGLRGLGGRLIRGIRIAFHRIPLELLHWVRTLRVVRRTDMVIVAGTGIVADYMCGPLGWPYDMFKLSVLATLCRSRMVFLSVGVGPIGHPLSRWFIKRSLGLAQYRSYRDEASRQYLEKIGFSTAHDAVYPDVVFGLSRQAAAPADGRTHPRRVVGLGLKDYGTTGWVEESEYRRYLAMMSDFVAWLYEQGYGVRLLIGDFQFDARARQDLVDLLKGRGVPTEQPFLAVEPAETVEELLRQLGQTDVVLSARYHNLVLAMILNKPALALSDHAKLDSLLTDLGLAKYRVPLENLESGELIRRFKELEGDVERLKPYISARLEQYRRALDEQYAALFAEPDTGAQPWQADAERSRHGARV
jgi:polysaccharide pyruvyl transferase WcaK-like protein